jgi:hypothetical protein
MATMSLSCLKCLPPETLFAKIGHAANVKSTLTATARRGIDDEARKIMDASFVCDDFVVPEHDPGR